jgi:hypothetical protein
MKNTMFFLAAIIVFTMAACSIRGTTTSTANRGSPAPSNEPTTLIITGLHAYNGLYISAQTHDNIYAAAKLLDVYHHTQVGVAIGVGCVIENGSVTLPVWEVSFFPDHEEGFTIVNKERHTGNGSIDFWATIWEGPEEHHWHNTVGVGTVSVTCDNGKAEGVFILR